MSAFGDGALCQVIATDEEGNPIIDLKLACKDVQQITNELFDLKLGQILVRTRLIVFENAEAPDSLGCIANVRTLDEEFHPSEKEVHLSKKQSDNFLESVITSFLQLPPEYGLM